MAPVRQSKIYFFFEEPVTLRQRTKLKRFVEGIFRNEGRQLTSLNYIFCSDRRLHRINREYLGHDDYTDIITFDLSRKAAPVEGEIYISVERVKENALVLRQTFKSELHRVIFHGALHLCGYGDKTREDLKKMRKLEDSYLSKYE